MEKKTWQKPELISLERVKPQESVLNTCKHWSINGDPTTDCTGCNAWAPAPSYCAYCSQPIES